jgi:hypothetical protein
LKLGPSSQLEDILNTVDRLQQFRLDDQRTNLPLPTGPDNNNNNPTIATNRRLSPLNEQFFDQLSKCQVRKNSFLLQKIKFLHHRILVLMINELY